MSAKTIDTPSSEEAHNEETKVRRNECRFGVPFAPTLSKRGGEAYTGVNPWVAKFGLVKKDRPA